jgi:hypothetical protein
MPPHWQTRPHRPRPRLCRCPWHRLQWLGGKRREHRLGGWVRGVAARVAGYQVHCVRGSASQAQEQRRPLAAAAAAAAPFAPFSWPFSGACLATPGHAKVTDWLCARCPAKQKNPTFPNVGHNINQLVYHNIVCRGLPVARPAVSHHAWPRYAQPEAARRTAASRKSYLYFSGVLLQIGLAANNGGGRLVVGANGSAPLTEMDHVGHAACAGNTYHRKGSRR